MKEKIVVVGAGPGGYVAAIRAAQLGGEVTLIEKENLGGTCLNWGCIPSKIYKQSADTLNTIKESALFAVQGAGQAGLDLAALQQRTKGIIASQANGIEALLQKNGVQTINATARFIGKHELELTNSNTEKSTLLFDKAIIACGSSPSELPFLAVDGKLVHSSNTIFSMEELPKSVTIIGGGVIGCEFACILRSFGLEVTVVEGLDRLLPIPGIDADSSKLLQREMKKKKIKIELNCTVQSAEVGVDSVSLQLASCKNGKTKEKEIRSDIVLVSVGRRANSAALSPEKAGIECDDRGWINCNELMQSSQKHIYAIGDALGPSRIMLAHTASTEGEIAAANALGKNHHMKWDVMPSAIFTMPEIASVGLSHDEAIEQYGAENISCETSLFRTIGKAQAMGELAGHAKMICMRDSGKIIGVHLAGAHATDILGEATLAINTGVTAAELSATIHAHPTLSEIMLETAFKIEGMPLHS